MHKPLVSIVMPIWNGQKYLSESILSVLNQTYSNIELILVDDASSDSTPEIISKFSKVDSRIRVFTNQSNLKLPASLNVGFRESLGEWLTWTSDDNLLETDCIEKLLKQALEMNTHFVFSDYQVINTVGKILSINRTGPGERIYLENTVGACFLYHRSVAEKVGDYAEDKFMFEDYDYWVRVRKAGFNLEHISKIHPYRYRIHDKQLSTTRRLPTEFIHYRYGLVSLLEDRALRARGYLSTLHLSLQHKIFSIVAKSTIKLFIPHPILGFRAISSAFQRRQK
jgi:glycosyltransferase involved in cell wall biosynthesis